MVRVCHILNSIFECEEGDDINTLYIGHHHCLWPIYASTKIRSLLSSVTKTKCSIYPEWTNTSPPHQPLCYSKKVISPPNTLIWCRKCDLLIGYQAHTPGPYIPQNTGCHIAIIFYPHRCAKNSAPFKKSLVHQGDVIKLRYDIVTAFWWNKYD